MFFFSNRWIWEKVLLKTNLLGSEKMILKLLLLTDLKSPDRLYIANYFFSVQKVVAKIGIPNIVIFGAGNSAAHRASIIYEWFVSMPTTES